MNIKYDQEIKIGGIEVTMSDGYNWSHKNQYTTKEELQKEIDNPEVMALKLGVAVTKHKQELVDRQEIDFEQYFMYEGMLCKAFHQKRGSDVTKGIYIDVIFKDDYPNNK